MIKEIIQDNKQIYKQYGLQFLIIIWMKLIGYLIITPIINIFLLWNVWWLGILFIPITYLSYVIALQGQKGIIKLTTIIINTKNNMIRWFKK